MKKTGKCPKCESRDVYTNQKKITRTENSNLAINIWHRFTVARYICSNCGYLEEYMSDKDLNHRKQMEKLKEKWVKHNR